MYKTIAVSIILFTSIIYSQSTFTVATDGSGNYSSIAQINNAKLQSGDIVSFKANQQFSDATLICQEGVTYNSVGSGQAIIGDALTASFNTTININVEGVTLDNLKVYGYKNVTQFGSIIYVNKGNLIIKNCHIEGGYSDNIYETKGIRIEDTPSPVTAPIQITRNEITNCAYGIYWYKPFNADISYNKFHNLWRYPGYESVGGMSLFLVKGQDEAFDCKYTVNIHHNEIYDFEYAAFAVGECSNFIVEYNNIHSNKDERIFQGGVGHGVVAKWTDDTHTSKDGPVGSIFRYNYVHDLKKYGEPGYTYDRPTLAQVRAGQQPSKTYHENNPIRTSSESDWVPSTYMVPYYRSAGDWNGTKGALPTANTLGGGGYGNTWIHNNIFENVHQTLVSRGQHQSAQGDKSPVRNDLGSYFVNNTILNCGNSFITNETGIIFQYLTSQAPLFTLNNIIDFVGTNSYAALRYEESEVNRGGADYNIYINNNKSSTEAQIGSNIASWFRYGSTNFMIGTNEKYNTNPNWSNINNKIFAASIGPDGVNIPDLRVAIGGNANDKGMAYNLIGDSFNGHKVGFDPDGRSFAYDILGNLRTTNDIGAIGTSGESVIITPESKSITPSITSQPINVTVENGTDATLSIEASCSDAIGYQWWKTPYISDSESKITESSKFVGVTSNRLTIKNIDLNDADISYICEVYNTKDPSNLWVNSNPVSIQITSDNSVDNNDPINIDNGLKVFLEALYDNNKMNSSLYNVKVFPLKQPYNVNPWNLDDNALISEVKPDYVAWIYVELRDNLTSSSYRKSAILTSDGSVLNPDGTDFSFSNIASGSYYVAIHHRNHLSIMSSVPVPISNQKIINYDFTSSSSSAYGSNSLVGLKGGKFGMFAGDADANGVINNLDFGIVANKIPFKGYASGDLDMNGIINVLDYSFINKNILKKSNLP